MSNKFRHCQSSRLVVTYNVITIIRFVTNAESLQEMAVVNNLTRLGVGCSATWLNQEYGNIWQIFGQLTILTLKCIPGWQRIRRRRPPARFPVDFGPSWIPRLHVGALGLLDIDLSWHWSARCPHQRLQSGWPWPLWPHSNIRLNLAHRRNWRKPWRRRPVHNTEHRTEEPTHLALVLTRNCLRSESMKSYLFPFCLHPPTYRRRDFFDSVGCSYFPDFVLWLKCSCDCTNTETVSGWVAAL